MSRSLTSVCVMFVALANLQTQGALAATEAVCREYAQKAVRQYEEARALGVPNVGPPAWTGDHALHLGWCLLVDEKAVTAEYDKREQTLAPYRGGQEPSAAQPPPPGGASAIITQPMLEIDDACARYAKTAVEHQQLNQQKGCGFSGPRWDSERANHENWCRQQSSIDTAMAEHKARVAMLVACQSPGAPGVPPRPPSPPEDPGELEPPPASEQFCNAYADRALQQRETAIQWKLPGIEGPVWSPDRNLHYVWCLGVSEAIADGEAAKRQKHLDASIRLPMMEEGTLQAHDYGAATIYSRINFSGASMTLKEGEYDVGQLTIGDNAVRSLEVTPGYQVVLLPHPHFLGEPVAVTRNVPDLNAFDFAGATSSIVVRRHDPIEAAAWRPRVAAFFEHADYRGRSFALAAGHHDMPALLTERGNDVISSLKVLSGYRVTLFQHDRFRGVSREVTRDWSDLGTLGLDDQVSSIVIEKVGGSYDLAVVSWCYEVGSYGHQVTFHPIVKNVGTRPFWAKSGRKYDMSVVLNSTRHQSTFTIPPSFVLQPGQVGRLPEGIKAPFSPEVRHWNFGFIGNTILHPDPGDQTAENDRFHPLMDNKPITGTQLFEDWDLYTCLEKDVGRTWKLELRELFVEKGDDEDPYFIIVGFRTQLGIPGSTRTFTNQFQNSSWASDVSTGDRRVIPRSMGTVYFQDVPVTAFARGVELIGAIVVALDADMSSWSAVQNMVRQTTGQLRQELEHLFEQKKADLWDQETLKAQISESLDRLFDSMDPSASDILREGFTFRWNTDDFLDYNALVFLANKPLEAIRIPRFGKGRAGFIAPQNFDEARALTFVHQREIPFLDQKEDDVIFRVTGSFEPIW